MPKLIPGNQLSAGQQRMVKAAFVYRLTSENGYPQRNPTGAIVEPISDAEWLEKYAFYIKANGDLANKPNHCEPIYFVTEEAN